MTPAELLAHVEAVPTDLVLLDKSMPDQSMGRLINDIKHTANPPIIFVLDGRPETEQIARDAGADAFLYKGDSPVNLLAALSIIQAEDDHE